MKRITTFVVALLVALAVGAQTMRRVELSTQGELPVPAATCVTVDDDGYLWLGCNEGLFRSDGYHLHCLLLTHVQRREKTVLNVADNHHGLLWVGTNDGLFCIDKADHYRVSQPDTDGAVGHVGAFCVTPDGSLYTAIGNRLLHFGPDGSMLRQWECTWPGDGFKWVCDIKQMPDGRILLAQCRGGLCQLTDSIVPLPYDSPYEPQTLEVDTKHGGVWIGSWGGGILWRTDTTPPQPSPAREGAEQSPASIGKTNDKTPSLVGEGRGWVALIIDLQLSFTGDTLWATTMQGLEAYAVKGAGVLEPLSIDGLQLPYERQILSTMSLDPRSHDLWVAGYAPTTFCVNAAPTPASPRGGADSSEGVTSLPLGGAERGASIICYSYPYIYTWHNRTGTTVLRADDYSVVGTLTDGIDANTVPHFEAEAGGTCLVRRLQDRGQREAMVRISVAHDVTRADTLNTIAAHESPRAQIMASLPAEAVSVSPASPGGALWVGTTDGRLLYRDTDGTMRPEATMPRPCSIEQIVVDSTGHVWALNMQYLLEYDPQTHLSRLLRANHPNLSMDFLSSICVAGKGVLVAGEGGAPRWLMPSADMHTTVPSAPRVSMVQTDSTQFLPSPTDSVLTVEASVSSIVLHLTTLNHTTPHDVTFAYRLRQVDSWMDEGEGVWTILPAGHNMVYLSALPHGRWTVEVRVADDELRWSQPVTVLTIRRLPAWWQTWWAMLLAVAAVSLGTVVVLRLWRRVRRLRQLYHKAVERRQRVLLQSVETAVPQVPEDDQQLLQRAVELVEKHIADEDYSVEQLASDLCMSRMTLYRRLQQVAGQTPSEFVRSIRLKYAARMIKSRPELTVSDVVTATGFGSITAFRRQFKAMFGVTPSEYK